MIANAQQAERNSAPIPAHIPRRVVQDGARQEQPPGRSATVDRRPEAHALRQLQARADTSRRRIAHRELGDAVSDSQGAVVRMTPQVVQRAAVSVLAGNKELAGNYENGSEWVTLPKHRTACWLRIGKVVSLDQKRRKFAAASYILPHIQSWIDGNMVLYRGVNEGHVVYGEATQGLAPAKPGANLMEPDYTSDNSNTRFIPFSSDRQIATMAAKTDPREGASEPRAPSHGGDQIGVLLRVIVGTGYSIGIFDSGEIQVLNPPQAEVIPVTGSTVFGGRRLDGISMDETAILQHLHELLDDPLWGQLGKGWLGWRIVPTGVKAMKKLLARNDWRAVLQIAQERVAVKEADRHPQTENLYERLGKLRQQIAPDSNEGSRDKHKSSLNA